MNSDPDTFDNDHRDFVDLEARLQQVSEPSVPDDLLPTLLDIPRCERVSSAIPSPAPDRSKSRRRFAEAGIAVSAALALMVWCSLPRDDADQSVAESESRPSNFVTTSFPHETDPCFILPQ